MQSRTTRQLDGCRVCSAHQLPKPSSLWCAQHTLRLRLAVAIWTIWSILGPSASSGAEPQSPAPPTPAPQTSAPSTSLRERLQKRISVDFRKTPLEDVIRIMTEQAGVGVVASPSVKGEATVKLTDVPLEEALRSILEVQGFDYVVGDNVVKIMARSEMPPVTERLATQIFEITYADVNDVVRSLEKSKSEVGSVSHIRGTSRVLVVDKESKVKDTSQFISQVDRMTPQILVEARIYDITSKDNFDLGVQWGVGSRTRFAPGGTRSIFAGGEPNGVTDPFSVGQFSGTTAKASSTNAGFRFGWLTSNLDVDVLLKAQNEKINAKLLANPRVLVLNDEKATMKIVSEIPYQQLTESALGGSIGTTAFREVGVELQVTAHLAVRDQMIRMHLKPVFSVVTGQVQVVGSQRSALCPARRGPARDRHDADRPKRSDRRHGRVAQEGSKQADQQGAHVGRPAAGGRAVSVQGRANGQQRADRLRDAVYRGAADAVRGRVAGL